MQLREVSPVTEPQNARDTLQSLHRQVFGQELDDGLYRSLFEQGSHLYECVEGDVQVGSALLKFRYSESEADLELLTVYPGQRRQGKGREFLGLLEGIIAGLGATSIRLYPGEATAFFYQCHYTAYPNQDLYPDHLVKFLPPTDPERIS